MNSNRYLATASGSALLAAMGNFGAAEAAPVTVSQTLVTGLNVSQYGSSYAGQFDLNSFLPPGTTVGNASAVSAFVTAYGYSPALAQSSYSSTDYTLTDSYTYYVYAGYYDYSYSYIGGYYSYSCGWFSTCYAPYYIDVYAPAYVAETQNTYTRDQNTYVQDLVDDTMLMTIGGQTAQDGTTEAIHNAYSTTSYDSATFVASHETDYYYTRHNTYTDILHGPVSVTLALDAANLADLSGDGIINFNIAALFGQFNFDSIAITATFEENLVAIAGPGATPLTAAVLAVLFAKRRRARKRSEAIAA